MSKLKTVLLNEQPKPVSTWRTDIENAPRYVTDILIMDSYGGHYLVYPVVYPDYDGNDTWKTVSCDDHPFKNSEIAYWMEIPELPKL